MAQYFLETSLKVMRIADDMNDLGFKNLSSAKINYGLHILAYVNYERSE